MEAISKNFHHPGTVCPTLIPTLNPINVYWIAPLVEEPPGLQAGLRGLEALGMADGALGVAHSSGDVLVTVLNVIKRDIWHGMREDFNPA